MSRSDFEYKKRYSSNVCLGLNHSIPPFLAILYAYTYMSIRVRIILKLPISPKVSIVHGRLPFGGRGNLMQRDCDCGASCRTATNRFSTLKRQ